MRYHLTASACVVAWTVRGLSVLIGLVLPLTLTSPASAATDVVKDDTKDGGLLAPSCLWLSEFQDIPRFKLDQRSFDVSDGVKTQPDALGYTRYLTKKGPGTGLN